MSFTYQHPQNNKPSPLTPGAITGPPTPSRATFPLSPPFFQKFLLQATKLHLHGLHFQ